MASRVRSRSRGEQHSVTTELARSIVGMAASRDEKIFEKVNSEEKVWFMLFHDAVNVMMIRADSGVN